MTKRVVVTGASGFIGSTLVAALQADTSFDVVPVSRSDNRDDAYLVEDYRDAPKGDVLIHLAENPDRAKVNQVGDAELEQSASVLDALMQKGFRFVIYCSSAVLYGDKGIHPYMETAPITATDTYSRLKLLNEERVIRSGGAVVRLANVVGPEMAENNVLSDILSQLSGNEPIVVRNSGPVRDFVWVEDVAGGIIEIVKTKKSGIYNMGSGNGVSIRELASVVLEKNGQNNREIHSVAPPDHQSFNVADVSKMRDEIGWKPKISISAAIKLLLERSNKSKVSEEIS